MKSAGGLKPQDVLVLLKIVASKNRDWRLVDLAQELGLSLSEVSTSLQRSKRARLIDSSKKKINWPALAEFVLHGLKYVCPAEPGPICRGVPTAHSVPLKDPALHQLLALVDALRVGRARERQIAGEELKRRFHAA